MIKEWWDKGSTHLSTIIISTFTIIVLILLAVSFLPVGKVMFSNVDKDGSATTTIQSLATHISTPYALKGVYMTACVAGEKSLRDKIVDLFKTTELNALVVDIKDYSGTISYAGTKLQGRSEGRGCRIPDLPEFLLELHRLNIYTIGRITVFQDPLYASTHPDLAIRSKSKPDDIWRDKNGLGYIDPSAKPYWDYIISMAKEGYSIGFDEINFDYIRFPSDGNLDDMSYTWTGTTTKPVAIKNFFAYLHNALASTSIVTSADLFGMTTTAVGDMGIGQVLENTFPYFDYIYPMVYPSHFGSGYINLNKPALYPYEVIKHSMSSAVERAINASTSPMKLRPWLQAFDLGAIYTPEMVRAQIQATYDTGLTGWILWNAGSVYRRAFLLAETKASSY